MTVEAPAFELLASGADRVSASSEAPANDQGPKRHGAKPHLCDPRYIHACHEEKWKLATWPKSDPRAVSWRPARCHSWRHAGPCALGRAAQDYARIAEALARHDRAHVVYAVLTLDPSAWDGSGWIGPPKDLTSRRRPRREGATHDRGSIAAAYRALADRWQILCTAMRREWGTLEYVSTVEQHRSGWPHLNVVIVCHELADDVSACAKKLAKWGRKSRGRQVARMVFADMLERAGFGPIAFIEAAQRVVEGEPDKLAAYIAKLAGQAGAVWDGASGGGLHEAAVVHSLEGQVVGEIAKLSQAPTRAPSHFRRLRSSKGFLPPKRKDETITGALYDEAGCKIGATPGGRVVAAALSADTREALEELARQASAMDDSKRNRGGDYDAAGGWHEAKQPRIIARLAYAQAVIAAKLAGEPIPVDPLVSSEPVYFGEPFALAAMDGMTLDTRSAVAKWLGPISDGPGMAVARKYVIGNRSFTRVEK